ncbi:protein DGCR6-like [Python bivittatus]|uniref:Protein DGCR6-like n=1 Tax=Python bivittatus TaxID=176946 RepID=A0A9F3QTU4_PYTBI|nr:protein DGCR6-like [Python bivittatus]
MGLSHEMRLVWGAQQARFASPGWEVRLLWELSRSHSGLWNGGDAWVKLGRAALRLGERSQLRQSDAGFLWFGPSCSVLATRLFPPRSSSQQRLSYTILSDLALALLDGTVFEIVQGLLEIQHLTERNLYNQRLKLQTEHRALKQEMLRKHKEDQQSCQAHNLPLLKAAQQRELEAVEQRIHTEQRMMDEKIVLELDQKVVDQQSTLEKAGVSGFYITTNPQELTLQMNLLELIRKLQQKEWQPRKPCP